MRKPTFWFSAAAVFVAALASAGEFPSQPAIAHAHYGNDGFWHCDEGYLPGENTVDCVAAVAEVRDRISVYSRLRQFELSERARPGTVETR